MQDADKDVLYDFPCSQTYRALEDYWLTGRLYNEPEVLPAPEPAVQEVIHRYSNMGADEFRMLREHDGMLKYLLGKQSEKDERKQDYY